MTLIKLEFTAVIESARDGGYGAFCPEVPEANGQGDTPADTKANLIKAIELIIEDQREDFLRGVPDGVIQEKILVG